MPKLKLLCPGSRFGRLTIQRYEPGSRRAKARYVCICNCGEVVRAPRDKLLAGETRSCGCLRREVSAERLRGQHAAGVIPYVGKVTHGLSSHELFNTWQMMHQRCENENAENFPYYGGRGIYVCERWSGSSGFPNFLADMGERPGGDYQLDRIDNDGPYSPDNTQWLTAEEHEAKHGHHVLRARQ